MSSKPKILIQLDPDKHCSAFDAVVAVDAGVDHLFQYSSVTANDVRSIVHGAIFTRGVEDLCSTGIFIGGTDVGLGEKLYREVMASFFGPMKVSVMLDSNGANSTAAAAVLCCEKHLPLKEATLLVVAATGPVGRRVCRMAAALGAHVLVHSRSTKKAEGLCQELVAAGSNAANLTPVGTDNPSVMAESIEKCSAMIACGAAGIQLISSTQLASAKHLRVAIDLNAVPPNGIEGVKATGKAIEKKGLDGSVRIEYGALGVGGLKMKIHKAAIGQLFASNSNVLDAEQMLEIGRGLS